MKSNDVPIRRIYNSIPKSNAEQQRIARKQRGQIYVQSRPINAKTPAARAAKAPVSFSQSAAAAPPVDAAGLTVERETVAVAVSVGSRVDTEDLRILDTLEVDVDVDVSSAALPKTPAEVAVLRIPGEELREAPTPAVDEESKTRMDDEDPVPKLHPSSCVY
jgi:hypothetical protein